MSLVATTKQCTAWNLQKLCADRDPVPTFVPKNKVETLYLGTSTVPEFYSGYLKNGAFTLVPSEYRIWAPSVNAVLYNVS